MTALHLHTVHLNCKPNPINDSRCELFLYVGYVRERMLQPTDLRSDMLSSFIRHGLEGEELFHEVFEQILAGSDTTAGSPRVIMLYIMTHPRVYIKLQAEIDEAVGAGAAPAGLPWYER